MRLALNATLAMCFTLGAAGCSDDASPLDDLDSGVIRDISDRDATPSMMDTDGDEDASSDASDEADLPPREERVESITYLRSFSGCELPTCQVELLFSLTGETMLRFQMGNITNQEVLKPEELEELRTIVGDELFVSRIREGFSCPSVVEPADFLVRLRTVHRMPDGKLDTELTDVTGCYYRDGAPRADGFIDFAESMYTRYYGEL